MSSTTYKLDFYACVVECQNNSHFFSLFHVESYCLTPDSKNGDCISLNACEPLSTLIHKAGLTQAEKRFLARSQCGWDGSTPKYELFAFDVKLRRLIPKTYDEEGISNVILLFYFSEFVA